MVWPGRHFAQFLVHLNAYIVLLFFGFRLQTAAKQTITPCFMYLLCI